MTAELRHERKSKEAAITRLNIEVQTLTRGNKALTDTSDKLHEKLAAAESKSKAETAEGRCHAKELQTKTERDAANHTGPVSRAVLVQWSKRPRIRHSDVTSVWSDPPPRCGRKARGTG